MPPTKPRKKLTDRQLAYRESMAFYTEVPLTKDGRKRVREIFAQTTGRYISKRRPKKVWKGNLKAFVIRCTKRIAKKVAALKTPNGATRAQVNDIAIEVMTKYKRVSKDCGPWISEKPVILLTGEVCGQFLDEPS